jgi:predicted small metal-binding protein
MASSFGADSVVAPKRRLARRARRGHSAKAVNVDTFQKRSDEGGIMAMSLRCADTGADCRGEWTTDTEDEFWKHWELHVAEAHPDLVVTPELREQTKGFVREV